MNPWNALLAADLSMSARLLYLADVFAIAGILAAIVACFVRRRGSSAGVPGASSSGGLVLALPTILLVAMTITMTFVVGFRWHEVNHFPSQTMSEVLTMFSLALVFSMVVLHFALGLARRGHGWAMLDDLLVMLTLAGAMGTHAWIRGLSTAQRDLPPALQSYWFPWHLSALIFSYATLAIAAFVCVLYFVTRFWSGVFVGGQSWGRQLLTLACLVLIPFVHVVTLPILAISGAVFAWKFSRERSAAKSGGALAVAGAIPRGADLLKLEKTFEDISFRTFAVGFPFLTAGVWMGAFWAQEAWANYWGWDSKENSALITWLVYVVYIHLRMLGGYRGEKAMAVLVAGAASVFLTFQLFGYLPDSQKSLHRYTDDGVSPQEGQTGPAPTSQEQARVDAGLPAQGAEVR